MERKKPRMRVDFETTTYIFVGKAHFYVDKTQVQLNGSLCALFIDIAN